MKRIAVAALLLGTLVPAGPAANALATVTRTAYAVEGPARGPLCALDVVNDASLAGDGRAGALTAGPVALVDEADPAVVHHGYVQCTVQVGPEGGRHAAADTVTVAGPTTPLVVALSGTVSFVAGSGDPVHLCTQVVVDEGAPLYWDDDGTEAGLDSQWSSTPEARCGPAFGPSSGEGAYGAVKHALDLALCATLGTTPPLDLPRLWDCPGDQAPASIACADGLDNDLDGAADYPADLGCANAFDPTEEPLPQVACSDGLDNDLDGLADYPADQGCLDPLDPSEKTLPRTSLACSDGKDNDADGLVDFPADADCASPLGISEEPTGCATRLGVTACATYRPSTRVFRYTATLPGSNWMHLVGHVDTYRFALPNGGSVDVSSCIVLNKGHDAVNPCGAAGGTFVSRDLDLVPPRYVGEANRSYSVPIFSVGVCAASLDVTVNGTALPPIPGLTVC